LKAVDSNKTPLRALVCILILVVSLQSIGGALSKSPRATSSVQYPYLSATSSQQLAVDIFTESQGRGTNASIGTYTVGDQIKFYVYVNYNCSLRLELVPPDGSVQLKMAGPVNAGTFVDYVDAQYPIGRWEIVVVAQQGSNTVTETAGFEVAEKTSYTSARTTSFINATIIEEARFDGKVIQVYQYPVGGVAAWNVLVGKVYFGPDIGNTIVKVQWLAITATLGYPPGYIDYSITLGDQVEVYGLVTQKSGDTSVTLNGSEDYYIKKLGTLDESPDIILFSREVFPDNLSVRIGGIVLAGGANATITSVDWNWGDSQSSNQQFPAAHTYSKPGTYVILIRATQSNGLSTTKSLSVTVSRNPFTQNPTIPELGSGAIVASVAAAIVIGLGLIALRRRRMMGSIRENSAE
jgi:hypothetical protein